MMAFIADTFYLVKPWHEAKTLPLMAKRLNAEVKRRILDVGWRPAGDMVEYDVITDNILVRCGEYGFVITREAVDDNLHIDGFEAGMNNLINKFREIDSCLVS